MIEMKSFEKRVTEQRWRNDFQTLTTKIQGLPWLLCLDHSIGRRGGVLIVSAQSGMQAASDDRLVASGQDSCEEVRLRDFSCGLCDSDLLVPVLRVRSHTADRCRALNMARGEVGCRTRQRASGDGMLMV